MRYISTYFDINFLPRGMALIDSLDRYAGDYILYILALDDDVVNYFNKLNKTNIIIIEVETYIQYFKIDKSQYKTQKEFYFSLTPGICLYILKNYNYIDLLLYLDADVYLFNDIEILYDEIGDSSISICTQRLPWYNSKRYGIYNVGVNSFRNDNEGRKCLEQWHKDCTTWKYGQKDYNLEFFSDQIWLDKWPLLYSNIKIIEHIGINTAPWNAQRYKFSKKANKYYVDDMPLVIYHFSSIKYLGNYKWHCNTSFTILNIKNILFDIYLLYIHNVEKYTFKKNNNTINLEFTGNSVKMFVYSILKLFHNHIVDINNIK